MPLRNHANTQAVKGLYDILTQWFSTWGVEVEDIMNQFWWEYKMKMHLLTTKLVGRYKAGSLVYSYRTTIQAY